MNDTSDIARQCAEDWIASGKLGFVAKDLLVEFAQALSDRACQPLQERVEELEARLCIELRYEVWGKSIFGADILYAAFKYHEWADNWRYVHCRNGSIKEVGPPLPTVEDIQAIYVEELKP